MLPAMLSAMLSANRPSLACSLPWPPRPPPPALPTSPAAPPPGAPPSLRLQYLTRYTTDTQLLALSLSLHWSSFVNSMCHDWAPAPSCGGGGGGGKGPCVGLSIPWVGLLSGGEGFHSRHHQNARNARHAERALLDPVYLVTCALERLGLVWSVQRQEAAGEARAGQRADLKAD